MGMNTVITPALRLRRSVLPGTLLGVAALAILSVVALTRKTSEGLVASSQKVPQLMSRGPKAEMESASIKKIIFLRQEYQGQKKVNRTWIYAADLASGKETKLVEGFAPDLSPIGDQVAFTGDKIGDRTLADPGSQEAADSFCIKVLDLRTNEVRDFSSLNGLHSSHPLWSRSGNQIAFTLYPAGAKRPEIGVLDPLTGDWQCLTRNVDFIKESSPTVFLDSWVADDQSILFHTMETVYEVGLDGTLLQEIPTRSLGISTSNTKLLLSSDKTLLVFNRTDDIGEGPAEMIYRFDLRTHELVRIGPDTVSGSAPAWLPSKKEILFTCLNIPEKAAYPDICKMAIDGTGLKTLVRNGDFASYSVR
jgi:Tol biopolymer transport system component